MAFLLVSTQIMPTGFALLAPTTQKDPLAQSMPTQTFEGTQTNSTSSQTSTQTSIPSGSLVPFGPLSVATPMDNLTSQVMPALQKYYGTNGVPLNIRVSVNPQNSNEINAFISETRNGVLMDVGKIVIMTYGGQYNIKQVVDLKTGTQAQFNYAAGYVLSSIWRTTCSDINCQGGNWRSQITRIVVDSASGSITANITSVSSPSWLVWTDPMSVRTSYLVDLIKQSTDMDIPAPVVATLSSFKNSIGSLTFHYVYRTSGYKVIVTNAAAATGALNRMEFVIKQNGTLDIPTLQVSYQGIAGIDSNLLFLTFHQSPFLKNDVASLVALTQLNVTSIVNGVIYFNYQNQSYQAFRTAVQNYVTQLQALFTYNYETQISFCSLCANPEYEVHVYDPWPNMQGSFKDLFFNLSPNGQLVAGSIRANYKGSAADITVPASMLFQALKMSPISKLNDIQTLYAMMQLMITGKDEDQTTYFRLENSYYKAYRDATGVHLEQQPSPQVKNYVAQFQAALSAGTIVSAAYISGSVPPRCQITVTGSGFLMGTLSQLSFDISPNAVPDFTTLTADYRTGTAINAKLLFDGIMDTFRTWASDIQTFALMTRIQITQLNGQTIYFRVNGSNYTVSPDTALASLIQADLSDGILNRADLLSILNAVQDEGLVSAVEFSLLQEMQNRPAFYKELDYVHVLANAVILGNQANAVYQETALGNLMPGSSAAQLQKLVNKWFLGLDRPVAEDGSYRGAAVGRLFVNGISYSDIVQGATSDCYFLAALAETARRTPDVIADMFIDNGDGTYTVRFFKEGIADYVTVDRQVPVEPSWVFVYANRGAFAYDYNAELWAALAEKAFVQIHEKWGKNSNSYRAIGWGSSSYALEAISGNAVTTGWLPDPSQWNVVVNSWNTPNTLLTFTAKSNPVSGSGVVPSHTYALVNYNSVTQIFSLFNPWGIGYGLLNFAWSQIQDNFSYYDRTVPAGVIGLAATMIAGSQTESQPLAKQSEITSEQNTLQDVLAQTSDPRKQVRSQNSVKRIPNAGDGSIRFFRLSSRLLKKEDVSIKPFYHESLSYKDVLLHYLLERAIKFYLANE